MNEFEKLQELTLKSIIALTERMQAQDKEIDRLKAVCNQLELSVESHKYHREKAEKSAERERQKYKRFCQEVAERSQPAGESNE